MYTHSSHMWNIHRRMTTGDGDTAKKMRHLAHDIIIWRSLFKINALANDTSSGCEKFFISEIHKSPYRLYINAFSRYDATTIFQSFNVFNVLKANVVSINCIVLNKMKKNASVRFLRFLFSLVVNATRFFFLCSLRVLSTLFGPLLSLSSNLIIKSCMIRRLSFIF